MMRSIIRLAFIKILVFSVSVSAQDNSSSACRAIQTPNDVLNCAKHNHIDVQVNRTAIKESELGIGVAKQRPNPEFEAEAINNNDGNFISELTLSHTFELGHKRRSRSQLAYAEQAAAETDLLKAKEKAIIQAVLNLYRIRQINHELDVVKDNLSTFKKARQQYKRIGTLNPEQRFSISIFEIAEGENRLRIGQLKDEYRQRVSDLHLATGSTFEVSKKLLPRPYKKWPPIQSNSLHGSDMKRLNDELEIAKSKYQLEKSRSWPDLKVGPKLELENGDNNEVKAGFALSVPLPLYQTNRAGRAKARLGIENSLLKAQLRKQQLETLRENLLASYRNTTQLLTNSQAQKSLDQRHAQLHRLLDRGVVQVPLIIELHRETLGFFERLHEQELRAVAALWRIHALDGRILEEKL